MLNGVDRKVKVMETGNISISISIPTFFLNVDSGLKREKL
jgi:hypothetical protein